MADEEARASRSIDQQIEIDAPLDAVWRALTEAEELVRWFPVYATVEPGVGGRVSVSWSEGATWGSPIEIWEPNRHLRLGDDSVPAGAEGEAPPARVALDYYLETRAGATVLRLVHSGFAAGADWDEYLDTLETGWRYFLLNLKHYLERHAGTPRDLVHERRRAGMSHESFWTRLLGADGLAVTPSVDTLADGQPYSCRIGATEVRGRVLLTRAPVHFAGTAENLNDALLFLELEPGADAWSCGIWLSTYGLAAERLAELKAELSAWADRIFPPAPVVEAST